MISDDKQYQNLVTLAEAAKETPYSQEYLSLLARRGKIPAQKVGRNWCVTSLAVQEYIKKQEEVLRAELDLKNTIVAKNQESISPQNNIPIPQGKILVHFQTKSKLFSKKLAGLVSVLLLMSISFASAGFGRNFSQKISEIKSWPSLVRALHKSLTESTDV